MFIFRYFTSQLSLEDHFISMTKKHQASQECSVYHLIFIINFYDQILFCLWFALLLLFCIITTIILQNYIYGLHYYYYYYYYYYIALLLLLLF